jgi:hypothetical protein
LEAGIPIEGICLYPITDYPGWDNERLCRVGLLSVPDQDGRRTAYRPLARELMRQQAIPEFNSAPSRMPVAAE